MGSTPKGEEEGADARQVSAEALASVEATVGTIDTKYTLMLAVDGRVEMEMHSSCVHAMAMQIRYRCLGSSTEHEAVSNASLL